MMMDDTSFPDNFGLEIDVFVDFELVDVASDPVLYGFRVGHFKFQYINSLKQGFLFIIPNPYYINSLN